MKSLITVHPSFDAVWPFAADHLAKLWQHQGELIFIRTSDDEARPLHQIVNQLGNIERLSALSIKVTPDCLAHMPALKEAACLGPYSQDNDPALNASLQAKGVRVYAQQSEGFWGQSVSEFALALTLCSLRRIPQTYAAMLRPAQAQGVWAYDPPQGLGRPGTRGQQFGDDPRFTHGTLEGKRLRIVGAGNIASRYASFAHMLGADVAAYDPFASEPNFHRAGSRREHHLEHLVRDAEIFVPMVPLTEGTRNLVKREHIYALPTGCLVVLATRALICDMAAIRERVLADELSLAADVFDVEPLPPDDPLLGRHNVVHTPHNAGRTQQANERWAEMLAAQFI